MLFEPLRKSVDFLVENDYCVDDVKNTIINNGVNGTNHVTNMYSFNDTESISSGSSLIEPYITSKDVAEAQKREKDCKELLSELNSKMYVMKNEIYMGELNHNYDAYAIKRKISNIDSSLDELYREVIEVEAIRDKEVAQSNIAAEKRKKHYSAASQSEILLVSNFSRRQWEHSEKSTRILFQQLKESEPSYLLNLGNRSEEERGNTNEILAASQTNQWGTDKLENSDETDTKQIIEASGGRLPHLSEMGVTCTDHCLTVIHSVPAGDKANREVASSLSKREKKVKKRSVSGSNNTDKNDPKRKKISRSNEISSILLELNYPDASQHMGSSETPTKKSSKKKKVLQGDTSVETMSAKTKKRRKKKSVIDEDKKIRKQSKEGATLTTSDLVTPLSPNGERTNTTDISGLYSLYSLESIESFVNELDKRSLSERGDAVLEWYHCREAEKKRKKEQHDKEMQQEEYDCSVSMSDNEKRNIFEFTEWKQQRMFSHQLASRYYSQSEYGNKRNKCTSSSDNYKEKENTLNVFPLFTTEEKNRYVSKPSSRACSAISDLRILRGEIAECQQRLMTKNTKLRTAAMKSMNFFKNVPKMNGK